MCIRINQLACCCVLLVSLSPLFAQSGKQHKPELSLDPIFGLHYNRYAVKYADTTNRNCRVCSISNSKKEIQGVFAHINSGGSDYDIVKETIPQEDDYGYGDVLLITERKCVTTDTDSVFIGITPKNGYQETGDIERLPRPSDPDVADNSNPSNGRTVLRSAHEEAIIRGLVRDAFQRGFKAYGGEAPFRNKVCSREIIENSLGYPIVQQELKAFCSKAPGK